MQQIVGKCIHMCHKDAGNVHRNLIFDASHVLSVDICSTCLVEPEHLPVVVVVVLRAATSLSAKKNSMEKKLHLKSRELQETQDKCHKV